MKLRDVALIQLVGYLLIIGYLYRTIANVAQVVILTILYTALSLSAIFIRSYYLKDKESLKRQLIGTFMSFIALSGFYIAVKEWAGIALDYEIIVLVTIFLLFYVLWKDLNLAGLEKTVMILVLLTIILVRAYNSTIPNTTYRLYHSKISSGTNYENVRDTLTDDFKNSFSKEDFAKLKPYLLQDPLRTTQPTIMEFEDGKMLLIESAYDKEGEELQISNITILPKEVAAYFRYYPLKITRDASAPPGAEGDKTIIETRGAFVGRATEQQKRDWYDNLIGVFGKKELWDELWINLEGVRAPDGPLIGSGTKGEGHLEFRFREDWKPKQKVLDEIYSVFQETAAKHGIKNLPVVFKWGEQ